ncbi:DNA polymerase III subunit gamma/tau [Paludibaculum fermentans]|uniref:DNA polymerase III subunit gamma/tau n=1 Tax=Paludibaculum fermentans TaxID=1473598 RepID=A0A7S7NRP4_PALFE|nr:DNA polymerase III subunit gamma/tau [Paludibaculum fermentans]QOY88528.1 DNA polymerase III subunit gamma/tau [Paludibaculum fermentans]
MYQVIARKYRPRTFAELIGQEHVRTTLENAITQQRIAHGYILAGQRGTGKTTIARILARCLNCVEGPTPTPCGVCSSCIETSQSSAPDVIEIDAASNRGINEMRELRENVRYRPSRDRYKVFIIDEAHQITNEAFNALLKTLEEPPEWAVFVLCTTESHKIPTTIASRCQQFSFRSVDFHEVVGRMEEICKAEGIEAEPEALAVIAQAGEGSVRDSFSALDQAIACCGNTLTGAAVRDLLGMYSLASLERVTQALLSQQTAAMLEIVAELESAGKNLQQFCREMARYFRNLLVAKITGKETRLIPAAAPEQARMRDTSAQFSEEDLTRWLQLTLELYGQLQYSMQPRLHVELGLMRLVHAGRIKPIEEALKELAASGGVPAPRPPQATAAAPVRAASVTERSQAPYAAPRPAASASSGPSYSAPPARTAAPPAPAPARTLAPQPSAPPAPRSTAIEPGSTKEKLIAALQEMRSAMSVQAVEDSQLIETQGTVEFLAPRSAKLGLMAKDVEKGLTQILGRAVRVKITIDETAVVAAPEKKPQTSEAEDEASQRAMAHPDVQRFQEIFPGSQVRGVRDLKE